MYKTFCKVRKLYRVKSSYYLDIFNSIVYNVYEYDYNWRIYMKKAEKVAAALLSALLLVSGFTGCNSKFDPEKLSLSTEKTAKSTVGTMNTNLNKPAHIFKADKNQNNPLMTNIFCADPTGVEYNGRLYVYGTNDNQQYLEKGDASNTYDKIKSFIIISTDDMVNWRYEGEINTAEIAPWIYTSWAPSITSRVEEDGLTHFYLYFSNSGAGVGVLTATDPTGPWSDPLGKPLIYAGMKGLEDCPNPFDPGVCIDGDGTGWLSFGGGRAPDGSDYMPGTARIVRLGSDMLSLDSDFAEIPAPYFFEASELNCFGGTYVYTYNNSWEKRSEWDESSGVSAPPACSMSYMTTKTPLNSESWEYRDYYLKNPGELGMEYSNNHTHLEKFSGEYYLLFHTLTLQKERGITNGFRNLCAYKAVVDEKNVTIEVCEATPEGTAQIKRLNPYGVNQAEAAFLTDCKYVKRDDIIYAECTDGNVIVVKGADFKRGSTAFAAKVKGSGSIEIRLDSFDSEPSAILTFDCSDWTAVYEYVKVKGIHDIFFVFTGSFEFDEWEFSK